MSIECISPVILHQETTCIFKLGAQIPTYDLLIDFGDGRTEQVTGTFSNNYYEFELNNQYSACGNYDITMTWLNNMNKIEAKLVSVQNSNI